MSRTPAGNRHQIDIQIGVGSGVANIQAVCVCQKLKAPIRFDRFRAEEDGREHLLSSAKGGKSAKGDK